MKKILLVDDDEFVTTMYESRLAREGYDVVCAHSAAEAQDQLATLRPVLIMIDLMMPETNGVDLLRYIRSLPEIAKTPVVVLSHGYVKELVDEAFKLGIVKLFTKSTCPPNKLVTELLDILKTLPSSSEEHMHSAPKTELPPPKMAPIPRSVSLLSRLPEIPVKNTTLQQQQKALADLHEIILSKVKSAISKPTDSENELVGLAIEKLVNQLRTHPEYISKDSVSTLMTAIEKLDALEPSPSTDPVAEWEEISKRPHR
jgi:CheY-like chemotaxis protein